MHLEKMSYVLLDFNIVTVVNELFNPRFPIFYEYTQFYSDEEAFLWLLFVIQNKRYYYWLD
ncbi:hypothetical protein GCM10007380_35350 [Gottfriedia solisilvae]|uniref:Uncharacterized protein n=1 Tax=Gottfriedia solisilvae TaxID=1516104 RepID=A0A8J3AUS0_9BACI|nr:hypothetical protein GCM10007380_35350 [Gottfriedia solisilvae]